MDIIRRYQKEMRLYPLLLVLVVVLAILGRMPLEQVEVVRDYQGFLDALGMRESSNDYTAVNRFDYMGRYQLGEEALSDAGFMDKKGNWTEKAHSYGIYSKSDFLASPAGQDAAVTDYHRKLCVYIRYYGLAEYLGQIYRDVPVTQSGLLAACHLVGVGSMKKALATGNVTYDGNRVPASEYLAMFADYDITEVWGEEGEE